MSIFKQLGRELDEKPSAVFIVYGIIFGLLFNYLPQYALPLIVLLSLYEIARKINWAVGKLSK